MASSLDQIVKGAPPPNVSVDEVASAALPTHDANDRLASLKTPRPPVPPTDPTSLLPSSPPQIYLNLLILEASLRSQYLTLRARRRQNTIVLIGLVIWILYFTYLVWLKPRDDGKGVGGSQYWLVDMSQKVLMMTGYVALILFWATGQFERGVRWPRRWIHVANRGLRGMNFKIVLIRGPWWEEGWEWIKFMMPFYGALWGGETSGSSYHFINHSQEKKELLSDGRSRNRIIEDGKEYAEEDIAPGGDYIKVILLPKPFTPDFRQNWEIYRTEYWERENERRTELRKRVRARKREIAKEEGGWLWWTGWRGWKKARGVTGRPHGDIEKTGHHGHALSATSSLKGRKRRPSTLLRDRGRDASHSRSSSRSTTPTPDLDDRTQIQTRERRWSTSTAGSTTSDRRKKPSASTASSTVPGIVSSARAPPTRASSSRPGTPNADNPWQSKRASMLSTSESFDSESGVVDYAPGSMGPPPSRRQSRRDGNVFPNAPSA